MLRRLSLAVALTLSLFSVATAQPVGTFRWQTAPFCNVLTLAVTANGPTYRLEGTDDQCGGAVQASAIGIAFANVDGSIGIGLTIVATPGGAPVHLDATIATAAGFSGTWRDSAGRTGAFAFTAGAGTGGPPRPVVSQTQAFTHTAAAGNCSWIDHPLINDDPNALVFVTPTSGVAAYVRLLPGPGPKHWAVCTVSMGAIGGHTFNVLVIKQ